MLRVLNESPRPAEGSLEGDQPACPRRRTQLIEPFRALRDGVEKSGIPVADRHAPGYGSRKSSNPWRACGMPNTVTSASFGCSIQQCRSTL